MNLTTFPVPSNENARIKALRQYDLFSNLFEKEYDFIMKMASHICDTPVSLITLLDSKTAAGRQQKFKGIYQAGVS